MEENKVEKNTGVFIRQVLHVLRRNLWLMLAVIILVAGCGIGYSYVRKPEYTANIRISFTVVGKESETIGENIQYINTIVDFVDEGVVVDRANAYYIKWVDNYKQNGKGVQEFYQDYQRVGAGVSNELFDKYDRIDTLSADKFIHASSIITLTKQNAQDTNWIFQIGYTDKNAQDALEKVYILALAYEHEIEGGEYFKINVSIENLGYDGLSLDIAKRTIVIVSIILGIVLAIIIVYLKNLLDNTIKDKAELERITNVQNIGCIELIEEVKNGK